MYNAQEKEKKAEPVFEADAVTLASSDDHTIQGYRTPSDNDFPSEAPHKLQSNDQPATANGAEHNQTDIPDIQTHKPLPSRKPTANGDLSEIQLNDHSGKATSPEHTQSSMPMGQGPLATRSSQPRIDSSPRTPHSSPSKANSSPRKPRSRQYPTATSISSKAI